VSPALEARGLAAGYEPGLDIVRGVDLALAGGEIVALLGPNGAGKSTLVKALAGLVPVRAGMVMLDGRDLGTTPAHARIGRGLAYVPQTENVFGRLSIQENLELAGARLGRRLGPRLAWTYDFFPDLAQRQHLPAGRLSGGQRQMLALARALLVEPAVLMLDEPSAGLSPGMVALVFERLGRIRAEGPAILLVEQNVRGALDLADRAIVMVDGRVALEAPSDRLKADPRLGALFLGRTAEQAAH
jgi:branched-chain amino acid transport system ATP-binding protein